MRFIPSLTENNTPCLSAEWHSTSFQIIFGEDLFHLHAKEKERTRWRNMGSFRSLEKALAMADILAENIEFSQVLITQFNQAVEELGQKANIDLAAVVTLLVQKGQFSMEEFARMRLKATSVSDQLGAKKRDLFDEMNG